MSNNTLSEVRLSRMKSFHNLVESGVASKTKMCLLSLSGARMSTLSLHLMTKKKAKETQFCEMFLQQKFCNRKNLTGGERLDNPNGQNLDDAVSQLFPKRVFLRSWLSLIAIFK